MTSLEQTSLTVVRMAEYLPVKQVGPWWILKVAWSHWPRPVEALISDSPLRRPVAPRRL